MYTLENTWKDNLEAKLIQFQQVEEAEIKQKMLKIKEEIAVAEAKQEVYEHEDDNIVVMKRLSPPKSKKLPTS